MRWTMEEKIKALKEQMEAALGSVESKEQLGEFWQNFLGKKGSIADLMKGLGSVPKEERQQERAGRHHHAGKDAPGRRTSSAHRHRE